MQARAKFHEAGKHNEIIDKALFDSAHNTVTFMSKYYEYIVSKMSSRGVENLTSKTKCLRGRGGAVVARQSCSMIVYAIVVHARFPTTIVG